MMEILEPSYEDNNYDSCGNITIAVVHYNSMTIPLCQECLDNLRESLKKYDNTIFCYKCNNFIMSESGWNYGGSCLKDLSKEDIEKFKKSYAGYYLYKKCLDTCDGAVPK